MFETSTCSKWRSMSVFINSKFIINKDFYDDPSIKVFNTMHMIIVVCFYWLVRSLLTRANTRERTDYISLVLTGRRQWFIARHYCRQLTMTLCKKCQETYFCYLEVWLAYFCIYYLKRSCLIYENILHGNKAGEKNWTANWSSSKYILRHYFCLKHKPFYGG